MDAGPEPIVAPNGVELTAHRLASVTVRGESGAEYLVDADRPDGQPVDVLVEQGTVWVTAQVGGSGAVVSAGAFRIDIVDGSVVIEAGFSGDGLVLVASGHVQLADATGTWQPLSAGQIAVLAPDGAVAAVDHVDDEELVEDRWVVANIGLDALDDQAREAAASAAAAGEPEPATESDEAAAPDQPANVDQGSAEQGSAEQGSDEQGSDEQGPEEPAAAGQPEPGEPVGPIPGAGHPRPQPVPAAPVDPAAVVGTVLAGLGRGPVAPAGESDSDSYSASAVDDDEPPWPPPQPPTDEPWAVGDPLPEGEEQAGHDLPYAPEIDVDDTEAQRRSRVRIIEIVLLIIVVIAAAAIIVAFNHKKHEDAGPPAIGSAASIVGTSTTAASRTTGSTGTTAAPSTSAAPATTVVASTTEGPTSTVPVTPTSALTTSGSTAGPVAFHITHCSQVNATKIVASGTVAGSVQNVSAYQITVAVVSPDGKSTLGQSRVRVPMATNGATVPWQATIVLPAGSTPGGCKLAQFDFV